MLRAAAFPAPPVAAQAFAEAGHDHHMGRAPGEVGQGAFAAIQEIVGLLEADPSTDWSKVDIEALRRHLIDMGNVTLRADVKAEPVDGGMRFTVSGAGAVKALDPADGRGACRGDGRRRRLAVRRRADRRLRRPHRAGAAGGRRKTARARLHRRDDARHASSNAPYDDRPG